MSTFSSVVRKPGQKIIPKAAPRRNVQRNATHPTPPATISTPESQSHSPSLGATSDHVNQDVSDGDAAALPVLPRNSWTPDIVSVLTPPSTALDRTSPLPTVATTKTVPNQQRLIEVRIPQVVRSVSRERSDGVPRVASSEAESNTGKKRKAQNFSTVSTSSIDSRQEEGVQVTRSQTATSEIIGRKKRKTVSTITPAAVASTYSPLTPRSSADQALQFRTTLSQHDSQPPEALLQQATSQAAAVSELANSIENRTRSLRPHSSRESTSVYASTDNENENEETRSPQTRRKKSRSTAIERAASAVVEEVVNRSNKRHRRGNTPEAAETHEIDTTATTMGELTRDTGLGKRSELGNRIDGEWTAIRRRWDQAVVTSREAAKAKHKQRQIAGVSDEVAEQLNELSDSIPVPQTAIINGMIVLDPTSREVEFGTGLDQAVIEHQEGALEDEKIYRYVNQARIGKNAGLRRVSRWDDETTDLFYKGLRMFGTDFEMIANLFPDFTRKQVKQKYVKEEKSNLARIRENLQQQQQITQEEFTEMTNMELQDPKEIENEIQAEEKRLREEDEKRRAHEGFTNPDADTVLPTTEVEEDVVEPESDSAAPTDHEARLQALANRVVEDAVAPSVPPRKRQRKPKEPSKPRTTKKGRKMLEGVEEKIGPIDEVEL